MLERTPWAPSDGGAPPKTTRLVSVAHLLPLPLRNLGVAAEHRAPLPIDELTGLQVVVNPAVDPLQAPPGAAGVVHMRAAWQQSVAARAQLPTIISPLRLKQPVALLPLYESATDVGVAATGRNDSFFRYDQFRLVVPLFTRH